jgi:hypothetical protein
VLMIPVQAVARALANKNAIVRKGSASEDEPSARGQAV